MVVDSASNNYFSFTTTIIHNSTTNAVKQACIIFSLVPRVLRTPMMIAFRLRFVCPPSPPLPSQGAPVLKATSTA